MFTKFRDDKTQIENIILQYRRGGGGKSFYQNKK